MKTDHDFKKKFGQNFLKYVPDSIDLVNDLQASEDDIVIEIGPGDGRVTSMIVNEVKKLVAIEVDPELIPTLEYQFNEVDNFQLIHQDVLQVDFDELVEELGTPYKVIGSLPYNISKRIIDKLTKLENRPQLMVFVLQKEVAEDYSAQPPKSSFLNQLYSSQYEIEYIRKIRKDRFYPEPKVDGGVIRMTLKVSPDIKPDEFEEYAKFLKNAYSSPRKKLEKVLRGIYKEIDWKQIFQELSIPENYRPAQLTATQFIALWHKYLEK